MHISEERIEEKRKKREEDDEGIKRIHRLPCRLTVLLILLPHAIIARSVMITESLESRKESMGLATCNRIDEWLSATYSEVPLPNS